MTMKHNNNGLSNHNGSFPLLFNELYGRCRRAWRILPDCTHADSNENKKKGSLNDGVTTKK